MGFLKLSYISETDSSIEVLCPRCKGLYTIAKNGLKPINEGFEIPSFSDQICPNCHTQHFQITSNQTEIKSNQEFIEAPLKSSRKPTSILEIIAFSIISIVVISIIFLIGAGIYANVQENSNRSSLQKFYNQHPEAYKADMQKEQQIQEFRRNVQTEIDRGNLN